MGSTLYSEVISLLVEVPQRFIYASVENELVREVTYAFEINAFGFEVDSNLQLMIGCLVKCSEMLRNCVCRDVWVCLFHDNNVEHGLQSHSTLHFGSSMQGNA